MKRLPSCQECVLDPLYMRTFGRHVRHDDNVEPHAHPREIFALLKQLRRRANQSPLFPDTDASGSAAVSIARAGTHFRDYEHIPLTCDEIELAQASTVISLEDLEPFGLQEVSCYVFSRLPDALPPREHPCAPGSLRWR